MTIDEVISYYGSKSKAARAIGVTPQAFQHWIKWKEIPRGSQLEFEKDTNGALIADDKRKAG